MTHNKKAHKDIAKWAHSPRLSMHFSSFFFLFSAQDILNGSTFNHERAVVMNTAGGDHIQSKRTHIKHSSYIHRPPSSSSPCHSPRCVASMRNLHSLSSPPAKMWPFRLRQCVHIIRRVETPSKACQIIDTERERECACEWVSIRCAVCAIASGGPRDMERLCFLLCC